jgi:hypothetical protein
MKKSITVTVDIDAYEKCRNANANLSEICNDALKHRFDDPEAFAQEKKLEAEKVIKAFKETIKRQGKASHLKATLQIASEMRAKGDKGFNAFLKDACKHYKISMTEAVRLMGKAQRITGNLACHKAYKQQQRNTYEVILRKK